MNDTYIYVQHSNIIFITLLRIAKLKLNIQALKEIALNEQCKLKMARNLVVSILLVFPPFCYYRKCASVHAVAQQRWEMNRSMLPDGRRCFSSLREEWRSIPTAKKQDSWGHPQPRWEELKKGMLLGNGQGLENQEVLDDGFGYFFHPRGSPLQTLLTLPALRVRVPSHLFPSS